MVEYIEKQAAIEALGEEPENWIDAEYDLGTANQWRLDLKAIKAIPPADVRLVRRAKWIRVSGFCTPGGDSVWECSECRKGRHVYGIEHGTYGADISDGQWVACPNCGAEMEVQEDG